MHTRSLHDQARHKKIHKLSTVASLVVLVSVTAACGTSGPKVDNTGLSDLVARQAALDRREQELNNQANALDTRQSSFNQSSATAVKTSSGLLPPGASAGECYTRVWQPPVYQSASEKRLSSEASERIVVTPAKYGNVTKRVLVQEASTRIETVPATYKTVSEKVLVQPAKTITEQVPAVYETVYDRILDKPAHTVWKKGTGPIQRVDNATGEIMCLVDVPATYKTISKQVLKTPATTRSRTIDAQYKVVKKRVVSQPATTRTIDIPAKYSNVTVVEEVQAASERRIPIPATYTTVSTQKLVREGEMQWREILCDTNTTPQRISSIQSALKTAGFNPGPIDGNLGVSTMRAVNAFQRSEGLPVDEYLNVSTVKALGVATK